jgi:hypothetical protein
MGDCLKASSGARQRRDFGGIFIELISAGIYQSKIS